MERWVEQNGDSVLGRTIKEMMKRQKEKNRKRKELLRSIGQNSNGNNDSNNNNNNNSNNISSNSNVNNSNNSTPLTQPLQPLQIVSTVTLSPSLQMLITKDENSDLAIWWLNDINIYQLNKFIKNVYNFINNKVKEIN